MNDLLKYELVDTDKLKFYDKNSRTHSSSQIEKICASIKEYGFINPVIIDKDYNIIAGHGRVTASQQLGYEQVPCLFKDNLTPAQQRAYIIADNKLALDAGWNYDILMQELNDLVDLDYDIDLTGFSMADIEIRETKHNERERTNDSYNLDEFDNERSDGYFQMPILHRTDIVPDEIVSFNYILTTKKRNVGVHFFIDDYQFERIWNEPQKYIEKLKEFDCVFTPDFSLYTEMPIAMMIWNVYRSRMIGQMMQDNGIQVIPTLSWCDENTYQFCFEGLPKGGTVAVSTIGVKKDDSAYNIWKNGMDKAIEVLKPKTVLIYGGDIGYEFNCETKYFNNGNTERMRGKK